MSNLKNYLFCACHCVCFCCDSVVVVFCFCDWFLRICFVNFFEFVLFFSLARSSSSSCFIRGKTEPKGVTSEMLLSDKKQREKKTRTKQNCESEKVSKEKCVCLEQWLSNHMVEIQWHIVLIFIAVFSWFFVSFCFCCFVCCCAIFKSVFLLVIVVVVAFWVLWKSFLFCFVLFVCDCANCCWLLLVVVLCCLVVFCCCCCFVFVLLKMKLKFNLFCCLQQQTVKIKFFQIWLFWQRQHKVKTWNLIACEKKTKHNQQKKLKWEFVFCFVFEIWQKLGPKSKLQIENKILHQVCLWWQKNSDQTSLKWRSKKFKVCFDAHSQKYHTKPSLSAIKNSKKKWKCQCGCCQKNLAMTWEDDTVSNEQLASLSREYFEGKGFSSFKEHLFALFSFGGHGWMLSALCSSRSPVSIGEIEKPLMRSFPPCGLKDHHEQNPCHPCSVLCAQKSTSDNNGNSFAKRATTTLKTVFQVNGIQLSLLHFRLWAPKSTLSFFETESTKGVAWFCLNFKCELNWIQIPLYFEFCFVGFFVVGCLVCGSFVEIDFCLWDILKFDTKAIVHFRFVHNSGFNFQKDLKWKLCLQTQHKRAKDNHSFTSLVDLGFHITVPTIRKTCQLLCQPLELQLALFFSLWCERVLLILSVCSVWQRWVNVPNHILSIQTQLCEGSNQEKTSSIDTILAWHVTLVHCKLMINTGTFHNQTLSHPNPIDTSHLRQNHHLLPPTKECANKTDWRRNESAALTKKNVPCKPKRSENLVFVWSTTNKRTCVHKRKIWFGCFRDVFVLFETTIWIWNSSEINDYFCVKSEKLSLLCLSLCLFLLWFCCCCILFLWLIFTNLFCEFFWICFVFLTGKIKFFKLFHQR